MNIVHYHQKIDLSHGGVVRAVLDMCRVLAERGHTVTLITHDDTDIPAEWTAGEPNTPAVHLCPGPAKPMVRFSKSQLDALRPIITAADVVHLHTAWVPANMQLGAMSKAAGVPYVVSIHGMLDDWCIAQKKPKKKLYLALGGRRMFEAARFVHCTAQGELDQASKWFPKGCGIVVPLVFDLDPYEPLPGTALATAAYGPDGTGDLLPEAATVLFLSRVHYKKGVDIFVRAIANLTARGIACRGIVAGTGIGSDDYPDQMVRLTEELGVAEHVRFVGMVSGDTKLSLYQCADVFALPTSQENFGFVLPEAMACAVPVITTKGVDIWPELEASGGAILSDRTPEAFADHIAELLSDEPRRRAMGKAGRAWVFEHLDPHSVCERLENMYTRAAKGTQP